MPSDPPTRHGPTARAYAVIRRGDEILLVRAASTTAAPGLWWLPGGGVDFGESPQEAVVREVFEETGLRARDPRLRDVLSDTWTRRNGDEMHAIRIIFDVDVDDGELRHERDGTTDLAAWHRVDELRTLHVADYVRHIVGIS